MEWSATGSEDGTMSESTAGTIYVLEKAAQFVNTTASNPLTASNPTWYCDRLQCSEMDVVDCTYCACSEVDVCD